MTLVHSTNSPAVIAGAGTMALEMVEQQPGLDAVIIALGGGSQCVGAIAVAAAKAPKMKVFAVGAAGAPAQHDSWHRGERLTGVPVKTFAEGIGTGSAYEMTFDALREGLEDFISVTEDAMYQAIRDLIRVTHNLPEGAGAAGLAGLRSLAPRLAGRNVAIVMCGGNLDSASLARVLA